MKRFTLRMDAAGSSETTVTTHKTVLSQKTTIQIFTTGWKPQSHSFHYCNWTDPEHDNFSTLVQWLVAWTFMYLPQGCTRWQSAHYWLASTQGSVIAAVVGNLCTSHKGVLTCQCQGLCHHYSNGSWCTSHKRAESVILNTTIMLCMVLYKCVCVCVLESFTARDRPEHKVLVKAVHAHWRFTSICSEEKWREINTKI
jgi:hypothetical protein